jgi:hypothetical protein
VGLVLKRHLESSDLLAVHDTPDPMKQNSIQPMQEQRREPGRMTFSLIETTAAKGAAGFTCTTLCSRAGDATF